MEGTVDEVHDVGDISLNDVEGKAEVLRDCLSSLEFAEGAEHEEVAGRRRSSGEGKSGGKGCGDVSVLDESSFTGTSEGRGGVDHLTENDVASGRFKEHAERAGMSLSGLDEGDVRSDVITAFGLGRVNDSLARDEAGDLESDILSDFLLAIFDLFIVAVGGRNYEISEGGEGVGAD